MSSLSRPQTLAWRNAVFGLFGFSGFGLSSWLSRVPAVRDHLGVSTGQMGVLSFSIAIGSIIGLLVSGPLIERFEARRTAPVALVGLAVFLPLAGLGVFIDEFAVTLVSLGLFGFGMGLCDVSMNVSGAANERVLGRNVMPLFHAVFSVGTVLGVGIGSAAEALGVPVVLHLTVAAAITLAGAVVSARHLQPDAAREVAGDTAGTTVVTASTPLVGVGRVSRARHWLARRLAPWRDRRILLIGLIMLGMSLAEGSADDWLPLAMVDGHGLDNASGSVVLTAFLVAMTVGRVAGAWLLDRFGRVLVLRVSAALAALGLLAVITVDSATLAVLGAIVWGLGTAVGFPVGISAAADDPRHAARNVSAVSAIGYIPFLAGPPLIGFVAEYVGLLNALIIVLVFVVIGGLVSGATRKPDPTTPPIE